MEKLQHTFEKYILYKKYGSNEVPTIVETLGIQRSRLKFFFFSTEATEIDEIFSVHLTFTK